MSALTDPRAIIDSALADLSAWNHSPLHELEYADTLIELQDWKMSPDRKHMLSDVLILIERFGAQFPQMAIILHALIAAHIGGEERVLALMILDHFMGQIADGVDVPRSH